MGMFDHLHYRGREYQTKDTPSQTLDNYKIEQDQESGQWYLWHEEYDAEWCENEGLFGGSIKQSNHRWSHCADFDGELRFYYYRTEEDQEEYRALFMNGRMLKIRCTQGEPLGQWLTQGIKDTQEKNMNDDKELADQPLDGRSDIVLNLEREQLYQLMLWAHEQDITLNQLVEQILQKYIDEYKLNQETTHENLDQ